MSRLCSWVTAALCAAALTTTATAQTYSFNADAQGWGNISGGNLASVSQGGGALNIQYNGAGDPHIGTAGGLAIATAGVPQIGININFQPQGGAADTIQLFFDVGGGFHEDFSLTLTLQPGDHMYWFDMRSNPNWTGTLNQLRIDPGGNGANLGNGTAAVDWIHLGNGINQQFNRNGDTEGWAPAQQITGLNASGGNLVATFNGQTLADPFMSLGNTFFNGTTHRYLRLRQNATGRANANVASGEIHGFPGSLGASFVRDQFHYYPNNGYSTILLDMGTTNGSNPSNNAWLGEGSITSWRIDNTEDALTGWQPAGQIAYDYVTVTDAPVTTAGPYAWDFSGSGPGAWRAPLQTPYNTSALSQSGGVGTLTGSNTLAIMNTDLVLDVAHRFLVFDANVTTTAARNNFEVRLYWQNDGRPFEAARFRTYTLSTNIGSNRYVFDLNTVGAGAGAYNGFPHGLLLQFGNGEAGVTSVVIDNLQLRNTPPPYIADISNATVPDNAPYSLTPALIQGAGVTWSKIAGPAAVTVNSGTGQVQWPSPLVSQSPATITIRATNGQGSDDETFILTVTDNTPPLITISGANPLTHECGTAYNDPGATASDNVSGNISGNIVTVDSVDPNVPDSYTVTYNVQDGAGNPASQQTRTVNVVDTTDPVITLVGGPVTLECGGVYTEPGYSASDGCSGDLTAQVQVTGSVNTAVPGNYTLFYNVQDDALNDAIQRTRTVTVADTVNPSIILLGSSTVTVECGAAYTDAGATAADACSGDLTGDIVTSNPVNTAVVGAYSVTYNVQDDEANAATQVTRTVNVVDTVSPVITRTGPGSVTLVVGQGYTDQGATALDACDGDLTASIVTINPVNPNVANTYTVRYNVSDAEDNAATEVTRTVNVVLGNPPSITINGSAVVNVACGSAYTDAGATASDIEDGNLSGNIVTVSNVNTAVVGPYEVTYNVTDSSGNPATEAVRTVNVVDIGAPALALLGPDTVSVSCGDGYADPGATALDACEGNISGQVQASQTIGAATAPGVYTIEYNVADASDNEAAPVTRQVTVLDDCELDAPASSPTEVTVGEGDGVSFSVNFDGNVGSVSFQWQKDDGSKAFQNLPGENAPTLTIPAVSPEDAGEYRCEVSDAVTTVYSPVFTLEVTALPLPVTGLAGLAMAAAAMALAGAARARRR